MKTFLIPLIVIMVILVVVSLVRGVIAFLQGATQDAKLGAGSGPTQNQLLQNKMMFNRIKYQALAVVIVALLMAVSR